MRSIILRFLACIYLLLSVHAGAAPPADQEDRAARLDAVAKALGTVNVKKSSQPEERVTEDRRLSRRSDLSFQFLTCVAGLENDDKDGALLFPLQVSGFTRNIDTASKPTAGDRKSGADYKKVKVTFTGLMGDSPPKVAIDLTAINQGSTFDAVQLVRDEVIRRVLSYFPDAEIIGRQKLYEKSLVVRNDTDERVTVYVVYRTFSRTKPNIGWQWLPGETVRSVPIKQVIPPKQSKQFVGVDGQMLLTASTIKIWAQNESGETWDENRYAAYPLVKENPSMDGERSYYGERPTAFTYVIAPKPTPRTFAERAIVLRNDTPESLSVKVRYRSSDGVQQRWDETEFDIAPKSVVAAVDKDGLRLRASQFFVSAEGPERRFTRHRDSAIFTVDEVGGRRLYRADKLGTYEYTFAAATAVTDQTARTRSAEVQVMDGKTTAGVARRGDVMRVTERQGDWVRVELESGIAGWIKATDLIVEERAPKEPPKVDLGTARIRRNGVALKIGNATIAVASQGEEFQVIERKTGWLKVQATVEGDLKQGWIAEADCTVRQ